MIVVATYTGRDGDKGYRHGQTYRLHIEANHIYRDGMEGWVPYQTLRAFLRNWTGIRVLQTD